MSYAIRLNRQPDHSVRQSHLLVRVPHLLVRVGHIRYYYPRVLSCLEYIYGKGQQKVTVEHVHVYPGGQAVVGMVGTSGADGRRLLAVTA
jgi:hypothetical protein